MPGIMTIGRTSFIPFCRNQAAAQNTASVGIPLFQAFSLVLVQGSTYCDCIKDGRKIDPPYNTGNDFIYNDSFKLDADDYADNSGQLDEEGNQLVQNTESNGRFHTDWLNMIYPRLRLAKDLLTDDGVIFISIDDNEQENLRKCCDEVFGRAAISSLKSFGKEEHHLICVKLLVVHTNI
jgi:hypothetical protein